MPPDRRDGRSTKEVEPRSASRRGKAVKPVVEPRHGHGQAAADLRLREPHGRWGRQSPPAVRFAQPSPDAPAPRATPRRRPRRRGTRSPRTRSRASFRAPGGEPTRLPVTLERRQGPRSDPERTPRLRLCRVVDEILLLATPLRRHRRAVAQRAAAVTPTPDLEPRPRALHDRRHGVRPPRNKKTTAASGSTTRRTTPSLTRSPPIEP